MIDAPAPVLDAGAAWYAVGGPEGGGPARGRLCAVFRRAAYLRLDGPPATVVAVGSGAIPSGPLHLRTPRFARGALRQGEPVTVHAGVAHVGRLVLQVRDADRWVPPTVSAAALRRAAGGGLAAAGTVAGVPPAVVAAVARSMARGDLETAAGALAGRGPGLTPAGDDILAGILLVDALVHPGREDHRRAVAAGAGARTNDVAAAFLRWAAVGQSVRPAHNLLVAVAAGDRPALTAARTRLTGLGASSGAALLFGIRLALG